MYVLVPALPGYRPQRTYDFTVPPNGCGAVFRWPASHGPRRCQESRDQWPSGQVITTIQCNWGRELPEAQADVVLSGKADQHGRFHFEDVSPGKSTITSLMSLPTPRKRSSTRTRYQAGSRNWPIIGPDSITVPVNATCHRFVSWQAGPGTEEHWQAEAAEIETSSPRNIRIPYDLSQRFENWGAPSRMIESAPSGGVRVQVRHSTPCLAGCTPRRRL